MIRQAIFLFTIALLGQQVPDATFSVKVSNPAYPEKGPVILLDAAHNNVHTAGGGYKTFADLVSSDGYIVRSNQTPFQNSTLKDGQVLVIVNARGAGNNAPMADRAKPAFTPQ